MYKFSSYFVIHKCDQLNIRLPQSLQHGITVVIACISVLLIYAHIQVKKVYFWSGLLSPSKAAARYHQKSLWFQMSSISRRSARNNQRAGRGAIAILIAATLLFFIPSDVSLAYAISPIVLSLYGTAAIIFSGFVHRHE